MISHCSGDRKSNIGELARLSSGEIPLSSVQRVVFSLYLHVGERERECSGSSSGKDIIPSGESHPHDFFKVPLQIPLHWRIGL